ncbi:acyl-CoA dehydrogenase family protein [Actinomycetospora sp. TBRC 11914]|uniref:acyl-CoA dehydrogenase family protein n=1 Tax=Actinomycetospora sp. TBRC 11914 TaxID=2729387 RepID=UPI00145D1F34|nr:acyl-CoA dehydrogenase family protein [Actinomycetospora sp. TBRC 11914]NMO88369.1 acyl-CoA/acyl-ACP dehydrogenase [Actinomycetospora sp. TBRC 11914]
MTVTEDPRTAHRILRAEAREFAGDVLAHVRAVTDPLPSPTERYRATRPFYRRMVEAGFLRRLVPQALGGDGTGASATAVMAEELVAGDPGVALHLFATGLGLTPLLRAGTPDQHRRFLAPFLATTGTPLASLALSEPDGTANLDEPDPGTGMAVGLRTTARHEDGGWVVDGEKQWVSHATGWDGTGPDLMTVVCRTGDDPDPRRSTAVLLVPGPIEGLRITEVLDPLGHRAHLLPRFSLSDVRVPEENLVGEVGDGLGIVAASFGGALIGACAVGVMRVAFDHALHFARTDRRGGSVPVVDHQGVGFLLADVKTRIETVRALTRAACAAVDAGAPGAEELSVHAKIYGSETAVDTLVALMRIVGVDSYGHHRPLAGLVQDALAYPLFSGGNVAFRRRRLHALLADPTYDPWCTVD